MQILILGSNGFLGKSIQKELEQNNISFLTSDIHGECDFAGDLSILSFVESLPNVDVIINCAAVQYVTPKKPIFFRRNFFYKNNVSSLNNLYTRYSGDSEPHFIHIGTSMMYDQDGSEKYFPSSKLRASGIYSESKILGLKIVNKFKKATTIVPCIIAGRGRGGLFKSLMFSIQFLRIAILIGRGDFKISIVHVSDVASLALKVIKNPAYGLLNVAADDALTIKQWIKIISSELKIEKFLTAKLPIGIIEFISRILQYRLLAKEQILMLKMSHVLDISDSKKLGWYPKYLSEDIIKETANIYKS
jgi:nucleoside-diphosphate-sugar epimerase